MGLITGLLTLPLAPVHGVVWVADQLYGAADRELNDPGVLRAQLAALNQEFEDGQLSAEEFEREEERLLDRLHDSGGAGHGRLADSSQVTEAQREPEDEEAETDDGHAEDEKD
ncbi:hypothetical protein GCM10011583_62370 [Streptomyces camponoticapitis]|uniref:Gas vesicle protein n=1 Tax=Streptomyces camponoticapitis TaxID=1616125 RepID=A0ABQ2ERT9_9ACTN|nr:hypothetical protein GCM10011583_62370 [Streptomyces camponoticapitis]